MNKNKYINENINNKIKEKKVIQLLFYPFSHPFHPLRAFILHFTLSRQNISKKLLYIIESRLS